jgi:hypothetical protein
MTPEKQRIKIAEACGWRFITSNFTEGRQQYPHWIAPEGWIFSNSVFAIAYRNSRESPVLAPPSYPTSLEAMHEAEKALTDAHWEIYVKHIISPLCYMISGISTAGATKLAHATAAKRAEAFLKTLNLWED